MDKQINVLIDCNESINACMQVIAAIPNKVVGF